RAQIGFRAGPNDERTTMLKDTLRRAVQDRITTAGRLESRIAQADDTLPDLQAAGLLVALDKLQGKLAKAIDELGKPSGGAATGPWRGGDAGRGGRPEPQGVDGGVKGEEEGRGRAGVTRPAPRVPTEQTR